MSEKRKKVTKNESGKVLEAMKHIPSLDRWCVEFGAQDGITRSNTRPLILNHDYSSVQIEINKDYYSELEELYRDNDKIYTFNKSVGFKKSDGLDSILSDTPVPLDFDFLSIDVDGNDYHIWKAINKYRPKIVCIEYNPTIPNEIYFVQEPNESINHGNSPRAIVELAKEKNYELVSVSRDNLFFVDDKYFDNFGIKDNSLGKLRTSLHHVTWIFSGYDGHIFIRGYGQIPKGGFLIEEKNMQVLKPEQQKYPRN